MPARGHTHQLTAEHLNITRDRHYDPSQTPACTIHEATKRTERKSVYTAPNTTAGPAANLAVCLFDARKKPGVTSPPILLGTSRTRQRATILRRLVDLFSHISSERRILVNNAGQGTAACANAPRISVQVYLSENTRGGSFG